MASILNETKKFCLGLLNIIYPLECELCSKALDPYQNFHICPDCRHNLMEQYFHKRHEKKNIYSMFKYDGKIKELLHDFKYKNKPYLAYDFAYMLTWFIKKITKIDKIELVTCVPLHSVKLKERFYNQSALVAKFVAKNLEIKFSSDVLIKTKATQSQVKLPRIKRFTNIQGTFKADSSKVDEKTILLIDDIITTSSTINECIKKLKEADASEVIAVSIAGT